jgi:hypothetical protein
VLANPLARQASLAVIEVTDGSRLTLGPGDLLRAEDTDGTGNKLESRDYYGSGPPGPDSLSSASRRS